MAWVGVVTNAGRALLDSYAAGGHTLNLTGATVGSGTVDEANLRIQTSVSSEKDSASIISTEEIEGGVKYKVQVGPAGEAVGAYVAHQIGLWAKLDNGANTLLMLAQDAEAGVSVPLASVSPAFAFALFLALSVDNTDDLTVNIDESAYVTVGTMNDAVSPKLDKANVYNGLDKTESGYALDARQGNNLDTRLSAVEDLAAGIITVGPSTRVNIDHSKAAASPFKNVLLTIPIEQNGSGTPSAGNVRSFKYNNAFSYFYGEYVEPSGDIIPISPEQQIKITTTEYFYSGIFDIANKKIIRTHGHIASYNGESLPGMWYSSKDVYSSGTTPSIGAEVVYELAEPTMEDAPFSKFTFNASAINYIKSGNGFSMVKAAYYSNDPLLHQSSVVNNLTNTSTDKPGSANMLRVLESMLLTTNTPTEIPSNADLDNYRANGVFYVPNATSAATISNIPEQQSGRLVVFSSPTRGSESFNYGFQIYFTQHNGTIYTRTRRGYEPYWTNWTYINNPASMIKRVNVAKNVTMSAMGEIKFCSYSDIADDCTYNKIIGITPQNIQTGAKTVIDVLAYSDGIYIDSVAAFTGKTINLLVTYATEALPTTSKAL